MRKWVVIVIILIVAFLSYNYIYQDHRDIKREKSEYVLTSIDISNEFEINPSVSETKYLNKTIEISGTISEINNTEITLDNKVFCQFSNTLKNTIKTNQTIKIKGRFIGFDSLLEEIKLDQCNIIN